MILSVSRWCRSSLTSDFGPFFFKMLLQFFEVCRHSFMHSSAQVLPQHFIQVEVWTESLKHLDCFLFHPFWWNFLLYVSSFFCCMTHFRTNFTSQTDKVTSDLEYFCIQRSPRSTQWLHDTQGPWIQNKNKLPPLNYRIRQLVWGELICCDWFLPDLTVHLLLCAQKAVALISCS